MADNKQPRFKCPYCDVRRDKGFNIRRHCENHHKDVYDENAGRLLVMIQRCEAHGLDLDDAIQRYLDEKVTIWTLKHKEGFWQIVPILRGKGLLRSRGKDWAVAKRLKYGTSNPRENPNYVKVMMERYGTLNLQAIPGVKEKAARTKLENVKAGLGPLYDVNQNLKQIKKIKKIIREKNKKLKAELAERQDDSVEVGYTKDVSPNLEQDNESSYQHGTLPSSSISQD